MMQAKWATVGNGCDIFFTFLIGMCRVEGKGGALFFTSICVSKTSLKICVVEMSDEILIVSAPFLATANTFSLFL